MLARLVLLGVMALATLPFPHPRQEQANGIRILLARVPLSDDITDLTVTANGLELNPNVLGAHDAGRAGQLHDNP
jgi:hypothetical protein